MASKYCSKCQIAKNTSTFSKDKSKGDGLNTWCKECSNACNHQYHEELNEKECIRYNTNIQHNTSKKCTRDFIM